MADPYFLTWKASQDGLPLLERLDNCQGAGVLETQYLLDLLKEAAASIRFLNKRTLENMRKA